MRLELVAPPLVGGKYEGGVPVRDPRPGLQVLEFIRSYFHVHAMRGVLELGELFMMGLHDPCCTARLARFARLTLHALHAPCGWQAAVKYLVGVLVCPRSSVCQRGGGGVMPNYTIRVTNVILQDPADEGASSRFSLK